MTIEEAKQQIAKDMGFDNFNNLITTYVDKKYPENIVEIATELAKTYATEVAKGVKGACIETGRDCIGGGDVGTYFDPEEMEKLDISQFIK